MKRKNLMFGAGRGPRLEVLERIKRSGGGLSVRELSQALGMSYMGVKAHCVALASLGYLTPWRKPVTRGRPLMVYRLADAGEWLFAGSGEEFALRLLEESAGLFGPLAPKKLLMNYFRTQMTRYRGMIDEEVGVEVSGGRRAHAFAKIRDREGRMSFLEEVAARQGEEAMSWVIRERHDPLAAVFRIYPEASVMEEAMVGDILGIPVTRGIEGTGLVFSPRS